MDVANGFKEDKNRPTVVQMLPHKEDPQTVIYMVTFPHVENVNETGAGPMALISARALLNCVAVTAPPTVAKLVKGWVDQMDAEVLALSRGAKE